jgi:uncharacterized repeat protein (TIGR03806 family)
MVAGLVAAASAMVGPATHAGEARPPDDRVPWTASRFAGTPDPPSPYVIEPAFPKLAFDRPVLLAQAPGSRRLFVGEVGGRVVSFPNEPGVDHHDLAIDLSKDRPKFGSLYGIAFHPRFEDNRYVYLCYTTENEKPDGTRVSRFRVSRDDPPRIDPESEKVVITWFAGGHNGGCLQFGPDGDLYVSTGDGTAPTPPDGFETGQDLRDLLSSVLRIDVDHEDPGRAYRVPADNPFVDRPGARPEIWAYGFRNPWRMSFDRGSGDLWVGDVGWELWELIFRVERGGNYGWSIMEGRQPVRPEGERGPTPIRPPVVDHPHSEAASITGGYVYRGRRLNDLQGAYVYGDYQSGKVWGLRQEGGRVSWRAELADTGLRLVSFGEDNQGELYLIEMERTNQVYRLIPNPASGAAGKFPRLLSETGLFASAKGHAPAPGVLPYAINAEAWSDGTMAERLLAIPGEGRIDVDPEGRWKLPEGTILARTVSLDLIEGDPKSRRRLETQVLHLEEGSWRPYTYAWDEDQSDAKLLDAPGSSRTFSVRDDRAPGGRRQHAHRFAARSECILCHNPWVEARTTVFGRQTASPLGFNAPQLNRSGPLGEENQIRRLERLGAFSRSPSAGEMPRLADPYDEKADVEARARAYLQVNCAHCHQFNAGGTATILLSAPLPLDQTKTVGHRPTQGAFGIDDARIIAPGEPDRSVLLYRIAKAGSGRMPRVGSARVDAKASRLIADWIAGMPRPEGENGDPREGDALAALRDPSSPPEARAEAIRRLTLTTSGALTLVRAIDRGAVPEAVVREVAARTKDHPGGEVRDLFERFVPDDERVARLGDAVDPEALLALAADAGRGRRWFFSEGALQCRACHRVERVGTEVGPDLDAIGSKYTKRELLGHILEPNREVDPRYAPLAVATVDGQVHVGLLVEKNEREVVLRDAKNQVTRIRVGDVEQQATQATSLMPEGLLRDLTAQQAADLLEFLASLKGR